MARNSPIHSGYSIINGSGSGSNANRIDVWVEYSVVSQNISANASQVYAYFYTALRNGYTSETHQKSGLYSTFTVDGTSGNTVSNGSYDFRDTTPMLLGSYSGYVYHNSDGTGYASVSGSFETESKYISGGSVSGTIYLPTIYREASLTSAPNFTDEENPTIRYSNPAGSGMSSRVRRHSRVWRCGCGWRCHPVASTSRWPAPCRMPWGCGSPPHSSARRSPPASPPLL